ncbi:MAG TPA: plastocyanin/azurin family copper-binding protein [Terriglobales bacterium]|nr:plastocyanin/azurin family copper-binding protein [Terriglobales bacterium]
MNTNILKGSIILLGLLALTTLGVGPTAEAQQNWKLTVGGESKDMGRQALAFLPNEIWIHAGDSITWTWQSDEFHTLTFLNPAENDPGFSGPGIGGCADTGITQSPAVFNGSACLTSDALVKGQTFTLTFTTAGNYKFECLVHPTMTGAVHVLNAAAPLPHDQAFYSQQGAEQLRVLLADKDLKADDHDGMDMDMSAGDPTGQQVGGSVSVRVVSHRDRDSGGASDRQDSHDILGAVRAGSNQVMAGLGETTSNAGGYQASTLLRFLHGTIVVHAGDTVEWTNHDPIEPHTITFGPPQDDPANPFPSGANVTVDPDGALHAILNSPNDMVHSGAILQALIDEPGLSVAGNTLVANPTRFRATFTHPGTYNYHCVFHDTLGMVGKVVVLP